MKNIKFLSFFILITFGAIFQPQAQSDPANPRALTWTTAEGMRRFDHSKARADFFVLANQFENQSNKAFCGPTSLAIVLNALRLYNEKASKPMDESLLAQADRTYMPKDPVLARFTPNTVFADGAKTRGQVLGEPLETNGKKASDHGLQLRQFHTLAMKNGLKSEIIVMDDKVNAEEIKARMIKNLSNPADFIVVNYQRENLGQPKGGHISPIGAYDQASDSFLIMDVNSVRAPFVWVSASDLFAAMKTMDTVENRGLVFLSE